MACSEQSPWRHSGGTHWDENRARSLEINTYINQIKNHVFNDVNVDIQTSKTEINSNIVKFWLAILQNQLTWRHVGFRALAPIKHLLAVLFCQATRTISIQFLKCFKECRQSFFDSLHHNSSGRSSTCCIHMYPLYFSFFPKQFCKIWQIFLREHPAHDHPYAGEIGCSTPLRDMSLDLPSLVTHQSGLSSRPPPHVIVVCTPFLCVSCPMHQPLNIIQYYWMSCCPPRFAWFLPFYPTCILLNQSVDARSSLDLIDRYLR